ncbi:rim15, signal transduction response regulator [Yamadazyma tenuis]|uniref:non-specific serine/threonine protein kinase n=1 Tax=Candida tenuis (strain ATCC 10573 / BCRC 21748 / CBS 615 / JCM 9827 / NBRC 10315 / NRRL Y-1498 / VKM Y-70) TaxID=590646 RepID=G3AX17_CANTC|nr:uncharacterized protein CANTEDRAFT_132921 [Yamadazyma tenuis ATCC 10573]EGV66664.1 hypothetical protein CANTEDRAFT_132921 [Yamadazyma tenuis ATCC 10573]WEJ95207.1 rim15, signal transduction response regulator [Yamadazyma tenuis]
MSKDDFFHQPLFQLSQTNLRDLERSVSPREIIPNNSDVSDLPQSNARFNDLIQGQIDLSLASSNNPTTVLELDLDGNIKYLSKNWEIIVGTKVKKMIQKPISSFIIGNNEDDLNVFNYAIEKMIKDDDSYKIQFITATDDKSIPDYEINITPNNSVEESETENDLQREYQPIGGFSSPLSFTENVVQHEDAIDIDDMDDEVETAGSDTSSKVSNNGGIIELEAQGILIHDSKTHLPTHSIWTIKPYVPLDLDLTIPSQLIDLLGFGSTIFENYLLELKESKTADETSVPQPQTVLCHICEQQIPAWFLEKHSDLCIVEHRTSEDLQLCHDLISDQKELILRIFESLYQQNVNNYSYAYNQVNSSSSSLGSSISSSSSVSSAVLDYKGLPLPNSSSNEQLNVTHFQSKPVLPIKKFPFGILSRLIELCDEALAINPIEINQNGEPRFSPNTEKSISMIVNFKPFETSDKAIKLIIQDTQSLINDKIDTLSRLYSVLKISEKIKKEVDELVLASVTDTVSRIKEQMNSSKSNSNSISNSTLNSPIDLNSPIHSGKLTPSSSRFSPRPSQARIHSPQPLKSPRTTSPQNLQPPPIITASSSEDSSNSPNYPSITPKDILLRGRSSNMEFSRSSNSISSLSSPRSRRNSKDITIEGFNELVLTKHKTSDSDHSSPMRSSPATVSSMPIPNSNVNIGHNHFYSPGHNLSSLQRNTPSSSPLISHSQIHNDSLERPDKAYLNISGTSKTVTKPPLSPLLVSQTPATKPSAGSIKDYEIIKAISKGAFGSVFLAKRKLTGDYVAIKCLKKSDMVAKNQILNVKSERAVMMKQSDSPYVAQLYSSFQTNNYLYLVMEYLNGGDCATLIKMLGTLGVDWTRRYVAEVIVGVEDLHKRGIIHRDLKPDNLLIDSTGHLKLTDFGLSRMGVIGRQRLQRKSSSSEHGVELFRRSLASTVTPGSPRLSFDGPVFEASNGGKRASSVTPFSLSPTVDQRNSISSPLSETRQTESRISIDQVPSESRSEPQSSDRSKKYDSPNLNPSLPRTSSETSFAIVEDDFHVSPSQSAKVTSYKLYDPQETSEIKFVGTPDYLAPETIRGVGQSEASDWWSLGCIMFEFLFGYPPYHSSTPQQVFTNILNGEIDWPKLSEEDFDEICPPAAKNLIERLLNVNPEDRLGYGGSDEIKRHQYFNGIDWDNLFNEIPSFIPQLDDPESTEYFDKRGADISQFPKDESESSDEDRGSNDDMKLRIRDDNLGSGTSESKGTTSTNSSSNSRRGSLSAGTKRERRSSKLTDPSEFGSFYFRNLNVLEKANKDVINRLKSEHLEHRGSFSSSSSDSTPIRSRGYSFGEKPNFSLNLNNSGSVGLGLASSFGPGSSSSTPVSATNSASGYFGPPLKDASPFKRPVSPMLTAFNRAPSPMKDLTGSPPSFKQHERIGSGHSSDDIPDFGKLSPNDPPAMRHRSSVNSLARNSFKDSPTSSDTEDNSRALMRVQKRRESSRRQMMNINELDILYCEPIPIVRHVIMNYFEKLGCIVVLVNDGDELIRRATGQVKFDMIFTALKLPKIGGIDAVKLIRHTNGVNSQTPLVAITSFAKEATQSGQFSEVLEKPVEFECLRQCLARSRSDEVFESDTEK